jgi:hypothetical protein
VLVSELGLALAPEPALVYRMGDDQASMYSGSSANGGSYYYSSADDSYDDDLAWSIAQVQAESSAQAAAQVSAQDEAQLQQAAMAVAGALAEEVSAGGSLRTPAEKLSLLQRAVALIADAVDDVASWADYQRGVYSDVSADAAVFTSSSGSSSSSSGSSSGAGKAAVSRGELLTMADVLLMEEEAALKQQQQQEQEQGQGQQGGSYADAYYYYDLLPGELSQAPADYPTDILAMAANVEQQQEGLLQEERPCHHQDMQEQAQLQEQAEPLQYEIEQEIDITLGSLSRPITTTTASGSTITISTDSSALDTPSNSYLGSADGFYYDDDVVSAPGLLPAFSLLLHRQGTPGAVGNLPLHSAPGPS